jgi:hypothetical protein
MALKKSYHGQVLATNQYCITSSDLVLVSSEVSQLQAVKEKKNSEQSNFNIVKAAPEKLINDSK